MHLLRIDHNDYDRGSITIFGLDGLNCRVCVPHKYHLFAIGLLTSTTCSCTVPILPHKLWDNTHDTGHRILDSVQRTHHHIHHLEITQYDRNHW